MHFHEWTIDNNTMDWGWCPGSNAQMLVHEGDKQTLKDAIKDIRLHDGTGTYNGLKWGIALLNPASNPLVQHLADKGLVSEDFRNRPLELTNPDAAKVVVLMTDGKITEQRVPRTPDRNSGENDKKYQERIDEWLASLATKEIRNSSYSSKTLSGFGSSKGVEHFLELCKAAAEAKIQVYTIAFDAPSDARQQMKDCVGGEASGRYFEASTDPKKQNESIEAVLSAIAKEINKLRLFN
jgi:hypothetical protein